MNLKEKNVFIIGIGKTGIATANFLVDQGAKVTISDNKKRHELEQQIKQLKPGIQTVCSSTHPFPKTEMVIPSPGVDLQRMGLKPNGYSHFEILGEIELAYRFNRTPLIAITGTNGKSTTTKLLGDILSQGGKKCLAGGNIGTPFISLLSEDPQDFLVLEISSFQLESVREFAPHIAIVLNITPDHLDRHGTMDRYSAIKENICVHQTADDFLILNYDDSRVRQFAQGKRSRIIYFSTQMELEEGGFMRDGKLVIRLQGKEKELCYLKEVSTALRWNTENILAAVLGATLAGISSENICKTLAGFEGLEHRMEWVRSLNGIEFINDSKSTNVGSITKSLKSLNQPIILIAGGQDKGSDFSPLKNLFKAKLKHLIMLGESRPKILPILNGSFSYEEAECMESAVTRAYEKATAGDVILLSPACASFDMFQNYEDRGKQFKTIVNHLE